MAYSLEDFVTESNRIEGINRAPTIHELAAHRQLLALEHITVEDLEWFVSRCQPGAVLRNKLGLNVHVGNHIAPEGGPEIRDALQGILNDIGPYRMDIHWDIHVRYEDLHPFTDGNGRSGRALWLWMMGGIEQAPLGFLHHFYYQTLSAVRILKGQVSV